MAKTMFCCARRPSHIYIGGWERGGCQEAPQVGQILLGVSPWPRPLPYLSEGEGKRREEGRKGEAESPLSFSLPFFPSPLVRPIWGAHQPLVAGAFPLLAHKAHIFCRGCPEPLPLT